MSERMLRFVSVAQQPPPKRSADERRTDFDEIYQEFARDKAAEQAARCSQCGVPFCQIHCPVGNNIPDWLKLTAEGRMEEAYEVSSATNTLPEVCGRICPQDRLCEGNCVIEQSTHGTVTIGAIEKYITETAFDNGWVKPIQPSRERKQTVGIIGAGPGGLAAAARLRAKGYQVTIYDRYDRSGGLLMYGIPNFKLEKHVVTRRNEWLAASGVTFKLNFAVGADASLDELRAQHDAVVIATGVYKPRDIQVPGIGLDNVVPALDFLTASNRKDLGDKVPEYESGALNAAGKNVVVVGGGDTAMDCVRTAVREGAKSVTCLYRRNKANMPGSQREVANAEEEGVIFEWLAAPEAFLGDVGKPGSGVTAVRAHRMRLGAADATGRQSPEPVPDSTFNCPADLVITALGFDPEDLPSMFGAADLPVTRWGTVKIDWSTMMTAVEGVFAVGDIVRGASLVVWAIRDGQDAADAIHKYMQNKTAGAEAQAIAAE